MYLLNTSTFKLHYFHSNDIPDYAILSHTWDAEEVSFHDMRDGKGYKMPAFRKIKGCCNQADLDGWQYVWIDSCCIDKSSSAELSEAINSMYRWYENAQVCYAYLSDIPGGDRDASLPVSFFRRSKWFTRGWTLQELLAPTVVVFFNYEWFEVGTKSSLYDVITSITGIEPLSGFQQACVAQKISWVSRRQTTRVEDMAYCLMGLLGVNMPPLYGEGENAFQRLQLELIRKSDDESIFAWDEGEWASGQPGGLLARSPDAFINSGNVEGLVETTERPPFTMTNKGLCIELYLKPEIENDTFIAPLNCKRQGDPNRLAICLKKGDGNQFHRVLKPLVSWMLTGEPIDKMETVYVPQNDKSNYTPDKYYWRTEFLIKRHSQLENTFSILDTYLSNIVLGLWKPHDNGLRLTLNRPWDGYQSNAAIMFTSLKSEKFILILEVDYRYGPWMILLRPEAGQSLKQTVDSFYQKRSEPKPNLRLDRVSFSLRSDLAVSVVLRKKMVAGEKLFVVKITTYTIRARN